MALPLLLAAAGSIASGISTIAGGVQSARANKAAALGAQIEAAMARLRGTQIGAQSRENLLTMEQNIDAVRSARGVALDSPTGQAIQKRTRADAYRAEGAAVLAELSRAGAADQAARGYRTAARWAVPLAVLSSASSFANAASYGSMGGGKK